MAATSPTAAPALTRQGPSVASPGATAFQVTEIVRGWTRPTGSSRSSTVREWRSRPGEAP